MARKKSQREGNVVAQNRKARRDYFIEQTYEAGIVLVGTEVKSLRKGQASISEAFADEVGGELFLKGAHIPEYLEASRFNHDPRRPRKLLLHKREIHRLIGQVRRRGMTVVPLTVFFDSRGMAKVELALARGKVKADKRAAVKDRDWKRQKARLMREKG